MELLTFQSMVLKNWCLLISSTPSGPAPTNKHHQLSVQCWPAGGITESVRAQRFPPKTEIFQNICIFKMLCDLLKQPVTVFRGGNRVFERDYFQWRMNLHSWLTYLNTNGQLLTVFMCLFWKFYLICWRGCVWKGSWGDSELLNSKTAAFPTWPCENKRHRAKAEVLWSRQNNCSVINCPYCISKLKVCERLDDIMRHTHTHTGNTLSSVQSLLSIFLQTLRARERRQRKQDGLILPVNCFSPTWLSLSPSPSSPF